MLGVMQRKPLIELRHLNTLNAAANAGSLVQAARQLGVTQSALSHQLRELEAVLGIRLLHRKSKPLRFTTAGEKLLQLSTRVLRDVEETTNEVLALGRGDASRLHLALECHSCFDWLLPTLDAFRDEFPELDLDLKLDALFSPLEALIDGRVDAVISTDPVPHDQVHYAALFRYETRLLVSPRHDLAERDSVQPNDLENEDLITYPVALDRLDVYRRFLLPAGVEPARMTCELTLMIIERVASEHGVAALPTWAVQQAVARGSVRTVALGDGLWSELHVAVRASDTERVPVRRFLELCRSVSAATLNSIVPLSETRTAG